MYSMKSKHNVYIYNDVFITIHLWVNLSIFSIFENFFNLFMTYPHSIQLSGVCQKAINCFKVKFKEKNSLHAFLQIVSLSSSTWYWLSLFNIRILLNKVAKNLQTFILKSSTSNMIFLSLHKKNRYEPAL